MGGHVELAPRCGETESWKSLRLLRTAWSHSRRADPALGRGAERCSEALFAPFRVFRETCRGVRSFPEDLSQARLFLDGVIPGRRARSSFNRFGYLLAGSTYDAGGIDYRLPDHVYAERTDW